MKSARKNMMPTNVDNPKDVFLRFLKPLFILYVISNIYETQNATSKKLWPHLKAVRVNLQSFGVPQSLLQCSVVTVSLKLPNRITGQSDPGGAGRAIATKGNFANFHTRILVEFLQ